MKYTAIKGTSVFVVLEHAWVDKTTRPHKIHDAVVHGAYATREIAEQKRQKIADRSMGYRGYLCVLKKTVEGKKPKVEHWSCAEYGMNTYEIKE